MAGPVISPELFELLKSVDTPTICNSIEVAQGGRGFAGFTRSTMIASDPGAPPIVGYAKTALIAGNEPPTEPAQIIRERRMDYYRYIAATPVPAVVAIEDVDFPACTGAFWGEVNTTVHKGLKAAGAITNGVMRDLGDLADGFPVIAGSIGPSHGHVHLRSFGQPVSIFGLAIADGDLIHADRHGAVGIPPETLDQLADAIKTMQTNEQLILEPARKPDFDIEKFEVAWAAFERART